MKTRESLKTLSFIFILNLLSSSLHAQGFIRELVTVIKITDGDTLWVRYEGQREKLKLIGIDTPESKVNRKARKDAKRSGQDVETIIALGERSTEYVSSRVKLGIKVKIEFDIEQRDTYGRLLGYVYLPNGKMLNEEIVKAGYANVMTIPPNVKYQDSF